MTTAKGGKNEKVLSELKQHDYTRWGAVGLALRLAYALGEGQAHLAAPDKGEAMNKCPFLMAAYISQPDVVKPDFGWAALDCRKQDCELWNERFGMCCVAVDAYLKGQADWRAEKALIRAEAKLERDRSEV